MLKKIIAILLLTVLSFGTVSYADVIIQYGYAEYVTTEMQVLLDNGIIKGDPSGNLRPDDAITRAEFATLLCRAIGVEELAKSSDMAEKNYFSDVPQSHWAAGFVNTAAEYNAIVGFEDGTFRPELAVTNEQVIKMLVAAWGYRDEAEDLGGYPNGYMEIASRYGVTDTVLFNYGIASKRWVAFAFTYGALAMPTSENSNIELPFKLEQKESIVPMPENIRHTDDVVSILKRITPESAKYERSIIEQTLPVNYIPFYFQGSTLFFAEEVKDRKILISVYTPNVKQPLADGYFLENSFDLSNIPIGEWQCWVQIINGTVRDAYSFPIIRTDDHSIDFIEYAGRTTSLNVQPLTTVTAEDVTFSGTQNSELNHFVITPILNNDGTLAFKVEYPFVVQEGYQFALHMNTRGYPIIYLPDEKIEGKGDIIEPVIVNGLEFDTDYTIAVSVRSKYGDAVILNGMIRFLEGVETPDYLFEGRAGTYTVDGYEIRDYE